MDIHNYVRCIELYLYYRYLYFGVTKTLLFCLSLLPTVCKVCVIVCVL